MTISNLSGHTAGVTALRLYCIAVNRPMSAGQLAAAAAMAAAAESTRALDTKVTVATSNA